MTMNGCGNVMWLDSLYMMRSNMYCEFSTACVSSTISTAYIFYIILMKTEKMRQKEEVISLHEPNLHPSILKMLEKFKGESVNMFMAGQRRPI